MTPNATPGRIHSITFIDDDTDLERRLSLTGVIDWSPSDPVAARLVYARIAAMRENDWRGCRIKMCKRARGCLAPGFVCGNEEQTR